MWRPSSGLRYRCSESIRSIFIPGPTRDPRVARVRKGESGARSGNSTTRVAAQRPRRLSMESHRALGAVRRRCSGIRHNKRSIAARGQHSICSVEYRYNCIQVRIPPQLHSSSNATTTAFKFECHCNCIQVRMPPQLHLNATASVPAAPETPPRTPRARRPRRPRDRVFFVVRCDARRSLARARGVTDDAAIHRQDSDRAIRVFRGCGVRYRPPPPPARLCLPRDA